MNFRLPSRTSGRGQRGFTLVELVIVTAIVGILASAVLPLARWSVKRSKEHELRQNLRILRNAIDRYRDAAAAGIIEVPEGSSGFPESLDVLVEGVPMIAEMPSPVPAVGGEYDASGPGLTGGLQSLAQQQQQAMGMGQAGQGFPGGAGGFGDEDDDGPGLGATGGSGFGGQSSFGSRGAGGSTFGGRGASGSSFGGSSFGGTRPGLQLGGQSAQRPGAGGTSPSGSSFGLQRPGGSFGSSAFGTSPFGQQGAQGEAAEPILGPDGQPLKLVLLRRLPVDPFTGEADWGLRCYGEPPADRLWCGKDVFDVYSKSAARAIDGTNYRDW